MPRIKPSSLKDLLDIIDKHSSDIENGTYDIIFEEYCYWTSQIPRDVSLFLIKHTFGSRLCIGKYSNDIEVLNLLSKDSSHYVRNAVAKNMHTPSEILTILAKDDNAEVRATVALNINTPPEVLANLAKDDNYLVVTSALKNPNAPTSVLESISKEGDFFVLKDVAQNLSTPVEVLRALAKNENDSVRHDVAKNPNTPTSVLTILSKDSEYYVRLGVAENINTSPEVFANLAKDDQLDVRIGLSLNSNIPKSVIDILVKDPDIDVRKMAKIAMRKRKECFIATAIYGKDSAPELIILKNYRDFVLMKNYFGRLFVSIYYIMSPTIATFVNRNKVIKYIIRRFILDPLLSRISKSHY